MSNGTRNVHWILLATMLSVVALIGFWIGVSIASPAAVAAPAPAPTPAPQAPESVWGVTMTYDDHASPLTSFTSRKNAPKGKWKRVVLSAFYQGISPKDAALAACKVAEGWEEAR